MPPRGSSHGLIGVLLSALSAASSSLYCDLQKAPCIC